MLFFSVEFELESFPTLIFFKNGINTGAEYRGLYEATHLVAFINEQIDRTSNEMVIHMP